jgi:hypothetical protein
LFLPPFFPFAGTGSGSGSVFLDFLAIMIGYAAKMYAVTLPAILMHQISSQLCAFMDI